MGTNLRRELIPLLEKLQTSADALYDATVMDEGIDWDDPVQVARADKAHTEFDDEMAVLRLRFLSYLSLDMPDLDGVADLFVQPSDRWDSPTGSSVYCHLANASGGVNDVAQLVRADEWTDHWKDPSANGWTGAAAQAFEHNFLVPFKDAAVAQAVGATELGIAAKALDTGVERAKQAVLGLCRLAIERFGGASTGVSLNTTPGIAAILADAVALFTAQEGVDALLAGAGVVGGLITEVKDRFKDSAGEAGSEEHDKPIDIAYAPTARELIPQVYLALTELDAQIAELDDQVNAGLEKDLGAQGPLGSPTTKIQNPGLSPSAYHQLNFQPLPGEPHDLVVVDIVKLYYAGYRTLPEAAAHYDATVKICGSLHLTYLQSCFPRSAAKFNEAAGQFSGLLAGVRDDLTQSGSAIVTAAKDYEYVDATDAAQINQCIIDIPPPLQDDDHYTPPTWLNLPGWESPTTTTQTTP